MSCCCSILTVHRPFWRFFCGLPVPEAEGAGVSAILVTRRASRDRGRSLKISAAGNSDVSLGSWDLGLLEAFS